MVHLYNIKHKCVSCLFFKPTTGDDGECHRHAIVPQDESHSYFPVTSVDCWCGDNPLYNYPVDVLFK
jgi:hypothetical protein